MGPDERRPYEIKANKVRNNSSDGTGGGSTNDSEQREKEKMQMFKLAIEDIEHTVGLLDPATSKSIIIIIMYC